MTVSTSTVSAYMYAGQWYVNMAGKVYRVLECTMDTMVLAPVPVK